jgi:septum formation inhibitor-activating ATPase MinD
MKEQSAKIEDKDHLSQEDLKAGIKTFEQTDKPHPALETPEGKNNGAEPAVYQNQRKAHP